MAIDFSRAFRGIATGALGAANRAIEQKDNMYAQIAVNAGNNYFQNILPQSIEAEKNRKETYDRIFSFTGDRKFAELMDRDGLTTLKDGFSQATELYKNVDKEKLKGATFEGNYEDRYNQRIKSRDEMYQPLLKQLGFGIGSMGPNTIKSQIEEDFVTGKDTQPAKQPTGTQAMEGMSDQVDQVPAPSMSISDFLVSKPVTYQLPETEFAKVAQGYGFNEMIKFNDAGELLGFDFSGNQRAKYNALRQFSNRAAAQFIDEGKKVNVGQSVDEGVKLADLEVHGTYRGAFGNSYRKKTQDEYTAEGKISGTGAAEYTAENYTKNFNDVAPTDVDKQAFFREKLQGFGTQAEQRYFALSAPEIPMVVTSRDGTKTKQTTLRAYLLSLVPTAF
tara:strand:- start:1747 stop:2916 length:1170 start_codon:yes stop_codon:yes gene_type:complete